MTRFLALTIAGSLLGCATNPPSNSADADDLVVVCVRESQIGTSFPRKVCRTKRAMDADRRAAEEELDRQRQQDPSLFKAPR
jgi:hypothetical protein